MSSEADYGSAGVWDRIGALLGDHRLTLGRVFGWVRCEPGWSWELTLRDFDIWSVVAGTGDASVNGRRRELHAGTALLLRPGDRVRARQHPLDRLTVAFAHYSHRTSPSADILPPRVVVLTEPDLVNNRLRDLIRHLSRPNSASPLRAEAELRTALLEVHTQAARRAGHLPAPIDPRIVAAIEFLHTHLASRPSLSDAAAAVGLSATHFSRLFRGEMGVSFRRYCVRARLDRAGGLLADTSLPVAEVAQLLGYSEYRLFARQFAAVYGGRSPSAWRAEMLNGIQRKRGI